jgi:hypothetical protein
MAQPKGNPMDIFQEELIPVESPSELADKLVYESVVRFQQEHGDYLLQSNGITDDTDNFRF